MRNKIEIGLSIIIIFFIVNTVKVVIPCLTRNPEFMDSCFRSPVFNTGDINISLLPYDTVYAQSSSIFSIVVYPDSVDFKDMWPGTTKSNYPSGGIICRVLTQYQEDWKLEIRITQQLTSDGNTISSDNFKFCSRGGYGEGNDEGNRHPDVTQSNWCDTNPPNYSTLTITGTKFYDAYDIGIDTESPNYPTGTVIRTKLKLTIPPDQIPGYYFTTIIYTLRLEI